MIKKTIISKNLKKWFGKSKVVDEKKRPLKVYHGTTHNWTVYSEEKGNPDNFFGVGFYASSSLSDVERNYKSVGADLTQRIELMTEHILRKDGIDWNDISDDEYIKAKEKALKKLKGDTEKIIEVYLKIENPLILTDTWKGTNFNFIGEYNEELDEYGESDRDKIIEVINNLIHTKYSEYNLNLDKIISALDENEIYDEIKANDLFEAFKHEYYLQDYLCCTKEGSSLKYNFIRDIFIELGFDGVIDEIPSKRFLGMGIPADTKHYIVWKPEQIKLADGSNIVFDLDNPDIRFSTAVSSKRVEEKSAFHLLFHLQVQ